LIPHLWQRKKADQEKLFLIGGPAVKTVTGDGDGFAVICLNLKLIAEVW
jgi:hypothetical protein